MEINFVFDKFIEKLRRAVEKEGGELKKINNDPINKDSISADSYNIDIFGFNNNKKMCFGTAAWGVSNLEELNETVLRLMKVKSYFSNIQRLDVVFILNNEERNQFSFSVEFGF